MDSKQVYLAQTDTTVGFLSQDDEKLSRIKQRPTTQKILQVVNSFATLNFQVRIPKKYRKMVRNAKKTTFIYPNGESYRVVPYTSAHHDFVKKFNVIYSTSANRTSHAFEKSYALKHANIIVEDKNQLFETNSSQIIKFSCNKIKKLR
ncbi:Sua5 YciO YrdC YwlC family protein [Candidatus Marinarcus aquaticus]|uniref:Sua5 YciO YrdC YwlC family protein n=1 Tax=Candidatus Marinarcus aquaticus TaxID=2044504 RepID=A0A4Q0XPY0_9BACT|nr:Sua5 YciO YrdC YwlC family protein [Candidatus Marinarcus aquaticus]RXJ54120.1 Sua5 YciO YrdC YwlC family protein [Candidatus Marinarcus aquaticus]